MRAGRKADLIVDYEMEGATRAIAFQLREHKRFRYHPLSRKGRIAVDQNSHDLILHGIVEGGATRALLLFGAHAARHDGIDPFQMGGVGVHRQMDGLSGKRTVDGGAEMVFHIARALHTVGVRGRALKFGKHLGKGFTENIGKDI